jgi:hypothetical protein
MLPKYQYDVLDETRFQIRLFRITDFRGEELCVHGALETFDLETAPPFQALSYVWGSEARKSSVHIGEAQIGIRSNLYDFLKTYSKALPATRRKMSSFSNYFWIDQLCINQNAVGEKNHQVQLMGRIYKRTERTIAWLGADMPDFSAAARVVERAPRRRHPKHIYKFARSTTQTLIRNEHQSAGDATRRASHMIWDRSSRRARQNQRVHMVIGGSEYWTRLWVVQELLLANDIFLMGGTGCLEWAKLASSSIVEERPPNMSYAQEMMRVFMAHRRWGQNKAYRYQRLSNIIAEFSRNDCTDPRDKIYALLGLLPEGKVPIPDYTKSTKQVFDDTLEYAVKRHVDNHGSSSLCPETWESHNTFRDLAAQMGLNGSGEYAEGALQGRIESIIKKEVERMQKVNDGPDLRD